MNKGIKIFTIAIIIAGLLMGAYLSGFFEDILLNKQTLQPQQSATNTLSAQVKATITADPQTVQLDEDITNFEEMPKSSLKVKYINSTASKLEKVRIRLLIFKSNDFAIGGSQTAKINDELSKEPLGPFVFDVADAPSGSTKEALINIIPRKSGTLVFKAELLTDGDVVAETEELTITAE